MKSRHKSDSARPTSPAASRTTRPDFFSLPLAFVDLETSGATAHEDRITEVGIITVDPDGSVEEWSSLVNPDMRIPSFIETLTGISNAMVEAAPRFEEIAGQVRRLLEGRVFIAHNVRFDYSFLKNELGRLSHPFRPKLLCTAKLSRALYPEHRKHNLDALIERHTLTCTARHRALGDAQVIWQFMQLAQREFDAELLATAIAAQMRTPSLPRGLDAAVLDTIPEGPGVYLFHDENNAPLYVGKSVNLRTRVMAHFSADHASPRDMRIALQLARVEWVETAGELGALLTEARMIKELLPAHNRVLRQTDEVCALRWVPSAVRSKPPQLVRAADLDPHALGDTFGPFRTRRKAQEALGAIAEAHGLCPVLLGLEKPGPHGADGRPRACLAFQLKKCRGACCGAETIAAHNVRLLGALMRQRMRAWPYRGLTGFREIRPVYASDRVRTDIHLFDHWCYLRTVHSDEELQERLASRLEPVFDFDTYRILSRFIADNNVDAIPFGRSTARQMALALEADLESA